MSEWKIYGHDLEFVVPDHLTIDGHVIAYYNGSGYERGDLWPAAAYRCDVFRVTPGQTYELEISGNQGRAYTAGWYLYYEDTAEEFTASRFKGVVIDYDDSHLDHMNGKYRVTAPPNCYALVVSAYNNANATICTVVCGQTKEKSEVVERATIKRLEYEGIMMGESAVTFDLSVPTHIDWRVGDWLDYRGERFVLGVLPKVKRTARDMASGDSLVYGPVRMRSMAVQRMTDCAMLDYVLDDNNIHYTSLPTFEVYCGDAYPTIKGGVAYDWSEGVQQIADRVLANLNRRYGEGAWDVTITNGTYIKSAKSISVSSQSVWDVLCSASEELGINFSAVVGTDGVGHIVFCGQITDEAGREFVYGKGNGLLTLERASDESQKIVTRVMAYGNTRNMPYRHYNYLWVNDGEYVYYKPTAEEEAAGITSKTIGGVTYTRVTSASMYLPNLMLPMFRKNGYEAYLDSVRAAEIGVREGSVYFNGENDLPDIYPSLAGVTTADVWNSLSVSERRTQGFPVTNPDPTHEDFIDVVVAAETVNFPGDIPEEQTSAPTFWVDVKNLGFDPNETFISGETPMLSVNSGMCAGREFPILSVTKYNSSSKRYYRLKCEVTADDSINQYFPNKDYQIVSGNKFVLTGIRMPDVYVRYAEARLQAAAEAWLNDNDHTNYVYTPEVSNIFMVKNPLIADQMKPGILMHIADTSLGIDERVTISHLKISEGKEQIPQWSVTLSDKIAPSLAQRTTKDVLQQLGAYPSGSGTSIDETLGAKIQQMLLELPERFLSKTGRDYGVGPIEIGQWLTSGHFYTPKFANGYGCHMRNDGLLVQDLYNGQEGSVQKVYIDFPTEESVYDDIASEPTNQGGDHIVSVTTDEIETNGGTLYFNFRVSVDQGAALVNTIKITAHRLSDDEEFDIELPNVRTGKADVSSTCILQLRDLEESYTFTLVAGVYVNSFGGGVVALAGGTLTLYGYGDEPSKTLVEKEVAPSGGTASRTANLSSLALSLTDSGEDCHSYLSAKGLIVDDGTNAFRVTSSGLQRRVNDQWVDINLT